MPMRRLLPLAALLALGGCMEAAPDLPSGPATPPIWVIADADTRIVLFGSVHQLPAGLDWTGGAFAHELAQADALLLELAPSEMAVAATIYPGLSTDEAVPPVASRFGDAAPALLDLLDDLGIDEQDADRTESWALALAVGNALAQRQALSVDRGVEAELTRHFTANGRPITGLETARQQLMLFDSLSPADQDRMVTAALTGAATTPARTRALLTAWADGDAAALGRIADEAMAETPMLREPVVLARNRSWAAALTARLEQPGHVVVAVGVGHLVGAGSLLAELRARGQQVARVQ
jgi:uncharacterized protein